MQDRVYKGVEILMKEKIIKVPTERYEKLLSDSRMVWRINALNYDAMVNTEPKPNEFGFIVTRSGRKRYVRAQGKSQKTATRTLKFLLALIKHRAITESEAIKIFGKVGLLNAAYRQLYIDGFPIHKYLLAERPAQISRHAKASHRFVIYYLE